MKKITFIALSCMLVFSACKKEDNGDHAASDLLKSGMWHTTASFLTVVEDGKPNAPLDLLEDFDNCMKDDYTFFTVDNHMIFDQGLLKCQNSGPQQTDLGIWRVADNNTRLLLNEGGDKDKVYEILQLNDTTLKIKFTREPIIQKSGSIFSYITETTYKHIK